jgi:hypothetical protein
MRKLWCVAVLLSTLAVTRPAWAQRTAFGGVDSSNLTFTPIDTSQNLVAPIQSVPARSFSLSNFFAPLHLPNFLVGPKIAVSPLPPPSAFPSTHYKSPLYPVAPILQGQ